MPGHGGLSLSFPRVVPTGGSTVVGPRSFFTGTNGGIPGITSSNGNGRGSSIGDILGDVARDFLGDLGRRAADALIPGDTGSGPSDVVPGNLAPDATAQCPQGSFRIPGTNRCADVIPGGDVSGGGMILNFGEAVMGRYGAALVPAQVTQTVARCPRGSVLGNDGLCYNKAQLRRGDRKWIPGRKPLLTGGDLNAISRASRAANKMKTQQKRLEKLGLLKRPTSRRAPARSRSGLQGFSGGSPVVIAQQD